MRGLGAGRRSGQTDLRLIRPDLLSREDFRGNTDTIGAMRHRRLGVMLASTEFWHYPS